MPLPKYVNPRTGEEVKFIFGVDAKEHLALGLVVTESDYLANQHGEPAKPEVKLEVVKEEPKAAPVAEAVEEEAAEEEEVAKPKRKAPRRRSAE